MLRTPELAFVEVIRRFTASFNVSHPGMPSAAPFFNRIQEEVLGAVGDDVSWSAAGTMLWVPLVGAVTDMFESCRRFARPEPVLSADMVAYTNDHVQKLRDERVKKRQEKMYAANGSGDGGSGGGGGNSGGSGKGKGVAGQSGRSRSGSNDANTGKGRPGNGGKSAVPGKKQSEQDGGSDGGSNGAASGAGGGGEASGDFAKPTASQAAECKSLTLKQIQEKYATTKKPCHFFWKTKQGCCKGDGCDFFHAA